jgi:TPR repeat protein
MQGWTRRVFCGCLGFWLFSLAFFLFGFFFHLIGKAFWHKYAIIWIVTIADSDLDNSQAKHMKTAVITALVVLTFFHFSSSMANEARQMRAEADQYYASSDYKRAFKTYLKLAKFGDRYSQNKVSDMYANGEGRSVDMVDAYAWAAVAVEGNDEKLAKLKEDLYSRIEDTAKAEKEAAKLVKKYGRQAHQKRIAQHNKRGRVVDEGSCTGSKLACPRN